jgi:hypothetical protein
MSLNSLHIDQNESLRNLLRKSVPPYSFDRLTRDLCEVIKSFGSTYPDEALSLCMMIAHRVASEKKQDTKDSILKAKPGRKRTITKPR